MNRRRQNIEAELLQAQNALGVHMENEWALPVFVKFLKEKETLLFIDVPAFLSMSKETILLGVGTKRLNVDGIGEFPLGEANRIFFSSIFLDSKVGEIDS